MTPGTSDTDAPRSNVSATRRYSSDDRTRRLPTPSEFETDIYRGVHHPLCRHDHRVYLAWEPWCSSFAHTGGSRRRRTT